mmetsp:Transcript_22424/g.37984  ORF Transcript_22424/g.37984 Transcript_22424/m.37984 type:complete len:85 (+) Transcript_22424:20-274(+)
MSKDDFVSKDVERINNLFESSDEMRAFSNEHEKELQTIRALQLKLSLKQVAMLGDRQQQSDEDIENLSKQLLTISKKISAIKPK